MSDVIKTVADIKLRCIFAASKDSSYKSHIFFYTYLGTSLISLAWFWNDIMHRKYNRYQYLKEVVFLF